MAKKTVTKKKVDKAPVYEATVSIMGVVTKNEGESVKEAISGLNVGVVKGTGVLTVAHGDNSKEKILNRVQLSKLFNTRGTMREINLKHITSLFEGI